MKQANENIFNHFVLQIVLAALCFGAYSNTLRAPFIFDDTPTIIQNTSIHSVLPLSKYFDLPRGLPVAGRPVSAFSFALNYAAGELDPFGYHVVNIAIHIAAALFLFNFLRITLRLKEFPLLRGHELSFSFLTSLAWALHPLQTEAVTYITQRTELLAGLFILSTLYFFARSFLSKNKFFWQCAAVAACFLGMGSKEVAAACPILVLMFDRVFVASSWKSIFIQRRGFYLALAASWIFLFLLAIQLPHSYAAGFHFKGVTWWTYLLIQSQAVLHYLKLAIWPAPLVVDYSNWPIVKSFKEVMPQFMLLTVLFLASGWRIARGSWFGFIGMWFFLILAPSSSIVPIVTELVAERRMYLPLLSVIVIGMVLIYRLLGRSNQLIIAIGITICTMLGITTWNRNGKYATAESIWKDTLEKQPNSFIGLSNLAAVVGNAGDYPRAAALLRRAIDVRIRRAIELKSKVPADLLTNFAVALAGQGMLADAEAVFLEMFDSQPHFYSPEDLALAHYNYAKIMQQTGMREKAEFHYQEAFKINPAMIQARFNLGLIYATAGKPDQAKLIFRSLLQPQPGQTKALTRLISSKSSFELAQLALKDGLTQDAYVYLGRSLEFNPDSQETKFELERVRVLMAESQS